MEELRWESGWGRRPGQRGALGALSLGDRGGDAGQVPPTGHWVVTHPHRDRTECSLGTEEHKGWYL